MARTKKDRALDEYRKKRDFGSTPEPAGTAAPKAGDELRFVIQKHDASRLHYDLRLEMDGVMRSWAVPKGPSLDPAVRRLAMEVEDHPIEYNEFEGIIPEGEYGGGTVMLWDQGTYAPDEKKARESAEKAVLRGYGEGKLPITLHGERLRGSFVLIRTDEVEGGARSKWLLMKQRDDDARPDAEITESVSTSVTTGRTMEEIAAGVDGKRVWRSNRERPLLPSAKKEGTGPPTGGPALLPMLASVGREAPSGEGWVFEPKYDGIRVLGYATPDATALVTRNGHDKAEQFPEVAGALSVLAEEVGRPLVVDGEITALKDGEPARFENLQSRMHLRDRGRIAELAESSPAAMIVFDLLLEGDEIRLDEPWSERRAALERNLEGRTSTTIRISEVAKDSAVLADRALREGWEGIIAKRTRSKYRPNHRTSDWLKLKMENRQELVVGGWTEPRKSRSHLGAILLGYFDADGDLVYAGHTGTGFTARTLDELFRRLKRLERKTSPFRDRPRTNQPAHWTTPRVVVEVKFNEWTRDGKLRQPVFLGIRDDKDARGVTRESAANEPEPDGAEPADPARGSKGGRDGAEADPPPSDDPTVGKLRRLASEAGEGELKLGRGGSLPLTSLGKTFFPATGHTKADLLVYYARMAEYILPRMKDRPLVLKRFPNGVDGESFYQQAAPDSVPDGVRVETLKIEGKVQRRLVGGNLATLLYTVQLGAISYDPWHSRVGGLSSADYTILDLDPGPGATFGGVVRVAGWVKEELDEMGLTGALKTSGSSGLHIYLPLPARTPLEAATLIAQIIATRVARKHPKEATVERMTKKRPRGTVYVDYLQNILGKTVAGVYAVRARKEPTVSTPLTWEELGPGLDLREFTLDTVPGRVARVGDVWAGGMAKANSLRGLLPRR